MKYYLICDYREKFESNEPSDHYSYNSVMKMRETINLLGFDCEYFGGVQELLHAANTKEYDKNGIYLNLNDGIKTISKRGQTPILLEYMQVKYSGSSPLTHLIISDKYFTNDYLNNKIPNLFIPKCILVKKERDLESIDLQFPIILKPNDEGSSIGIFPDSLCYTIREAKKVYRRIKDYKVLAQQFIKGYELTDYFIRSNTGKILFNELLIVSKGKSPVMDDMLFTPDDKFNHHRTYYNPIDVIGREITNDIKKITNLIAAQFNILTLGRVDYRYSENKLYFIEANTIPAFSKTSEIGKICTIYHYDYNNIVKLLLQSID